MLTFSLILDGVSVQAISTSENPENVLAFPGAEGGGKYTSGGRGQDVYEVTTIEDYGEGEEPIKGSLRDAVSQDNRTIVFRVSGTIHLKQPLRIKRKKTLPLQVKLHQEQGLQLRDMEQILVARKISSSDI